LTWCEIDHRGVIREEESTVRDRIAAAASWSLRHLGRYTVSWVPGTNAFEIQADPLLPTSVDEQHWGELPGIPIGVTDLASADGVVETIDATTGDLLVSLPVKLINPADSEKHLLVIGGTGSGKSNFTRGFIARALRMGWFPGGVFIFDGKGGSDYIPFEGRVGDLVPDEHSLSLAATVHHHVVAIAFEGDVRVGPRHPRIECIMQKQVSTTVAM
jgi:hypothetical protein